MVIRQANVFLAPRAPTAVLLTSLAILAGGPASAAAPALIDVDGPQLLKRVRAGDAKLTVVNVWATWCEPCKEEFPELLRVAKAYEKKGVRLWFVSTDFGEARTAAVAFLKAQGAPLPSFVMAGKDEAFINTLSPKWVGTLPATFIFDQTGRRLRFVQGKIEGKQLEKDLDDLLTDVQKQSR